MGSTRPQPAGEDGLLAFGRTTPSLALLGLLRGILGETDKPFVKVKGVRLESVQFSLDFKAAKRKMTVWALCPS